MMDDIDPLSEWTCEIRLLVGNDTEARCWAREYAIGVCKNIYPAADAGHIIVLEGFRDQVMMALTHYFMGDQDYAEEYFRANAQERVYKTA